MTMAVQKRPCTLSTGRLLLGLGLAFGLAILLLCTVAWEEGGWGPHRRATRAPPRTAKPPPSNAPELKFADTPPSVMPTVPAVPAAPAARPPIPPRIIPTFPPARPPRRFVCAWVRVFFTSCL